MTQPTDPDLEELLRFIRDARGFDFTGYKRSSLTRRIRKRMADIGVAEYPDYQDLLEASAAEFGALFNTILINVTGFFRDEESWAHLRDTVLPELLLGLDADEEIRVWSAGCSSGEEAYTLAIVLAEVLGVEQCVRRVKIYSTDVDDEALRRARLGTYPSKAVENLPAGLVEKYFEPQGDAVSFRTDLRRRVIFGRHDITRDAPISRLHLLVCRNTLMYFNVEAQQAIVDRFTFAMNDRACLFLGKAEMLLADGNRFEVVSMRHRMFRRRGGTVPRPLSPSRPVRTIAVPEDGDRQRNVRDLVLDTAPNAIVAVDMAGVLIQVNGQARALLGMGPSDVGRPFRDLEISYRPLELRSLIEQAHDTRRPVRVNAVERRIAADEVQYLDIVVQPLIAIDGELLGAGIAFIDNTLFTQLQQEVKRSREELETTNEELQSTNEELETTNEELQSSIEELETTNEELQSTNEELETTNEELQSGNEELETMNEEMRIRGDELGEARTFLEGVLSSVAAGVVVLDAHLRVRSWNRGAEELWGLRAAEVDNEDFFKLDFGLPTAGLATLIRDCVAGRSRTGPVDVAAVNRRGRAFTCSLTCNPLNSADGGVVLLMEPADQG
ncbi:CheR family methyltransferase [Actinophytocola sp. NPDC049390]|uniref:CheR family methyltransferase n=1 Tax=Actinophytocola sp. NPDC049390 TaxID=3363894 RepID=UPI0037B65802